MNKHNSIMLGLLWVLSTLGVLISVYNYKSVSQLYSEIDSNLEALENIIVNMELQKTQSDELYDSLSAYVGDLYSEIENVHYTIASMDCSEVRLNRWDITLTDDEIDLLARIVMLEAGDEPNWGKEAVVEVIFNRIYREDFPNTLEAVLSEKGQFTTWKNRNSKAATPTDDVYESIENVLYGKTDILPYETVYFGMSAQNNKKQMVIGNHIFCNQY